jgi:hypothetical protein
MNTLRNGDTGNGHIRRLRIDGRPMSKPVEVEPLGREHSGRVFITAGGLTLLVLSAVVFGFFQDWRSRYRALAEFGASRVAPAINPLVAHKPPGITIDEWEHTVDDTRAMLIAVTASGLLDKPTMEVLRNDLAERVAQTKPETAVTELSRLWDEMETKAGPILTRRTERAPHPPRRPRLLLRADPPKKTKSGR